MDLLLRNRTPRNGRESKILKDRRADERREALLKHLKEEELLRLNNSWYTKQQQIGENSPLSPRPYGVLSESELAYGETIQKKSPSREDSHGKYQGPFRDGNNRMKKNATQVELIPEAFNPSSIVEETREKSPPQRPQNFPSIPRSPHRDTISNLTRSSISPDTENEYASAKLLTNQIKSRKLDEFSGHQVARLLGGNRYIPLESCNHNQPGLLNGTPPSLSPSQLADALLQQMKLREEEANRQKLLELQYEIDQVRATMAEARANLNYQDDLTTLKREEARRFIEESERAALDAYTRRRRIEEAEETLARLEREAIESRRMQELTKRRELIQDRLNVTSLSSNSYAPYLANIPKTSVMYEAVRRLLDAHSKELDILGPIILDILNEPESLL